MGLEGAVGSAFGVSFFLKLNADRSFFLGLVSGEAFLTGAFGLGEFVSFLGDFLSNLGDFAGFDFFGWGSSSSEASFTSSHMASDLAGDFTGSSLTSSSHNSSVRLTSVSMGSATDPCLLRLPLIG